ncbi:hypothetical protein FNO01nite_00160 [Flavobacterium noncentrifugens]|uniref:DNA uptake protein ComE n=1 Tax=Flavobacterium noncentrifugens TaxID=1128970 RepID=A0A1G8R9A0_9FLAO|nr:helix-hairpin-helix domain-containing protein [Flavobacterium noncentrifugens]GEP49344.1 hypothetical protein FNO01nite_00160 [Flavobacterium noncentrifugens]SDJ13557.1 DNA uptake protein ComE [Flavobacterium noncentrifugens]
MKFSSLKPYFSFSKTQRIGLLILFTLFIVLEAIYFLMNANQPEKIETDEKQWISLQSKVDSLNHHKTGFVPKIYPFNPNFITDFKGYKLGMSVDEIDRLLQFRKSNRFVNSTKEFQDVTKVSDSLLAEMAPYFKFPDWVKNKKSGHENNKFRSDFKKEKLQVIDINLATPEDLKRIYGIGDGLSERILKEKDKFGGFVSMEQMNDIWGLSPEVIEKLTTSFSVKSVPDVKKIHINDAPLKELMQFPYFRYSVAKAIVTYRSMNGKILNVEDLTKISGFPVDKVKIIALYLEF